MTWGARHGHVVELPIVRHAAQEEPAAAHVASPDEVFQRLTDVVERR